MSIVEIKSTTVSDLESMPNFCALLEEYAAESSIYGLPHPRAKIDMYKAMEKNGALKSISAHVNNELIGFITVLTCIFPHYSDYVSVAESFFVTKSERGTGAGMKLLRMAEVIAKELNSKGLLVSAPFGGTLAAVLELTDYKETNRVFFKAVA